MKKFRSNQVEDTQALAKAIAALAYPGLVITLTGDLGAGKTTFTQGFARAAGVKRRVKSPTFNIMSQYEGSNWPLYHFDAYRLENTGAQDQGFEDFLGTDGVALVEWPQYMADILPNDRLILDFKRLDGDDQREITVTGQGRAEKIEQALS
ncbi:tRNA (adenosine(37)-N6)-threonylcarbamoyltransferase complex ATPase subunit type 1 TsaE [Eupransor demetentiae]|uniref:tRNA threonylcarbamoyladenosine biosynthesis protein TsaE n=1 Tax=Eupransor demetentiae TaxID=3109584 RepID=A0ABP0ESN7_9LACO|nr:tRNA A37 threonylcarbamoyladenosine biosynthesis protein TsaE (TsaE) [Lactobacillaceae bacterium LMG 33000]